MTITEFKVVIKHDDGMEEEIKSELLEVANNLDLDATATVNVSSSETEPDEDEDED